MVVSSTADAALLGSSSAGVAGLDSSTVDSAVLLDSSTVDSAVLLDSSTVDAAVATSSTRDSTVSDSSGRDGAVAVVAVPFEVGRRCRHNQPPSEPSAPITAALAAVAAIPQLVPPAPLAFGIGATGGFVHVGVMWAEGDALARLSTVDDGDGATVGKALGEALRAAATYSSPPRSLRELPPPPPCGGFCVGGGWLLCEVVG